MFGFPIHGVRLSAPSELFIQPNQQLLELGFATHRPCVQLQPWVQLYWSVQVPLQLETIQSHALYPDGGSNLTFEFFENQLPEVYFHGKKSFSQTAFSAGERQLSIRFQPAGAFQLLGISPTDLSPQPLDMRSVNLVGLDWLLEQLAQHPVLSVQLTAVECWLLSLAEQMVASGSLIQKSLPSLQQPLTDLQHLYLQVPKSRRQFERRFKLETGFSPAQLQLLYKVKLARLLISRNPSCDLASIAQDAGFYDQSHFHQHFVRITGQTPGQYKKRKMSQISNFHR
jgi:AraC-like DNA-binding protein